MTYRMMGGCLGAAWGRPAPGPHTRVPPWAGLRTFKHSPGGVAGTRPPPLGRCSPVPSPLRVGGLGETCVRVPASSLTTTKRRTTQMNLGGFIDTFKTPSPGGWWSPTRRSTGPRRTATGSLGCSGSPGGQADAIRGAALPQGSPGHHRRRRDGHRQDLQCAA